MHYALAFASYSIGAIALLFAIRIVRLYFQHRADRMRRTFELSFPSTMSHEDVLGYLGSLTSMPSPKRLRSVQTVVMEYYADQYGERYFVHLPNGTHTQIDQLLQEHIDGIDIELVEHDPVSGTKWGHGLGIFLKGSKTPLNVDEAERIARSVRSTGSSQLRV
jgi:hypothetical protein